MGPRRSTGPLALAAFVIATLASIRARAATEIAGDLDWAFPIHSNADSGAGFGVRLGAQLRGPFVVLTPELGFTYDGFGGDFGPTVYRGVAGLRLGFGEILRPGVYTHVGFGRLDLPDPLAGLSHTDFTYDVGAFVDFTLLPILNLGVHAAYNRLDEGDPGPALEWATVGPHAALIF